jgi:hypothetical protein
MVSSDERAATGGLDPEARLLLLLARLRLGEEDAERVRSLIEEGRMRWGAFLELAARHKVLPLVARHIAEHGLNRSDTGDGTQGIPFGWIHPVLLMGNRDRNRALAAEALLVTRALDRHGVPHAMRKGLVVAAALYGDVGARRITDIDVLLARDDAPAADAALRGLGYVQGRIAPDGGRVEPFSPEELLRSRAGDEQLPYVRLGARPDLPVISVDLGHALVPERVAGRDTTAEVLARARRTPVDGAPLPRLDPADELRDLCAQLHEAATDPLVAGHGVDLPLIKFLDVAVAAAALEDDAWDTAVGRAAADGQRDVLSYALSSAEALQPGSVPARVLDAVRPADASVLDEYGAAAGRPMRWLVPFPERLFAEGPEDLVAAPAEPRA